MIRAVIRFKQRPKVGQDLVSRLSFVDEHARKMVTSTMESFFVTISVSTQLSRQGEQKFQVMRYVRLIHSRYY